MHRALFGMLLLTSAVMQSHSQTMNMPYDDTESSGEVNPDDYVDNFGSGDKDTPSLETLAGSDINTQTVAEVINQTQKLLANPRDLGAVEILQTAIIIERTTQVPSIPKQTAHGVLKLVDTVSELNTDLLSEADTLSNVSNRLIRSVDGLGQKVDLEGARSVRLVSTTMALEVWDLSNACTDDLAVGLQLKTVDDDDDEDNVVMSRRAVVESSHLVTVRRGERFLTSETDTAINLTSSFMKSVVKENQGKAIRMWMTVFSDTTLFDHNTSWPTNASDSGTLKTSKRRLNSKVISASVTADRMPVSGFPSDVVTTVFLPLVQLTAEQRSLYSRCVFWDFREDGGQGGWSQEGCRYLKTVDGRDVCVCDHLTNFAVLLDFYGESELPPDDHQDVLSVISVVGLTLSICGLTCTILTFFCIKKMHSILPKQVIFNLALSLLCSWVVFLAGFSRASGSHGGCVAVAALLHYFILASFLWMLVEGILQYLLLVKVHGHINRFLLKASLIAWGVPVIPVITILAIDLELYKGFTNYCWMSLTPFYFGFLLPVGLVLSVNIVFYVLVIVSICRVGSGIKSGKVHNRVKSTTVSVRASFACFVVLGLSWLFAFFAIADARLVFQYLFTLTTSLQGFLIFLVFTARDPQVREFWREKTLRGMTMLRRVGRSQTTASTSVGSSTGKSGDARGPRAAADGTDLVTQKDSSSKAPESGTDVPLQTLSV